MYSVSPCRSSARLGYISLPEYMAGKLKTIMFEQTTKLPTIVVQHIPKHKFLEVCTAHDLNTNKYLKKKRNMTNHAILILLSFGNIVYCSKDEYE